MPRDIFPDNPRFRAGRRLGEGGFGVVYEAFDREWGIPVALKVLRSDKEHGVVRFKQEFRSLADVRHPNLVKLHRLYVEPTSVYFTMDLVDGGDLRSSFRRQPKAAGDELATAPASVTKSATTRPPPLAPEEAPRFARLIAQLASALAHLHRAGWVHRDVKPSNILLTRDDRVVLVDFGLIDQPRRSGVRDAWTGLVPGTPGYVAPEVEHDVIGTASDCWSVGVVMADLLVGAGTREDALRARAGIADGPLALLLDIAARLLDRDPTRRATVQDLLRVLETIDRDLVSPTSTRSDRALPFIGRDRERFTLANALDALERGEPSLVRIRGAAGVGKSALVAQMIAEAGGRHDCWIFRTQCRDRELVPFRGVDALMDQLGAAIRRDGEILAQVASVNDAVLVGTTFPALAMADGGAATSYPAHHDHGLDLRRRMFHAWRNVIAAVGARRRLVFVIDDAHWGDADSGLLLSVLVEKPAPVLVIIVHRTESDGTPLVQTLNDAVARHGRSWTNLDIEPLNEVDSRALVRALVARDQTGSSEARLEGAITAAAGNPLLLVTMSTTAEAGMSLDFDEWIAERLRALPSASATILELVSISSIPLREDVLRIALSESAAIDEAVIDLDVARFLRRIPLDDGAVIEPFHDRVRQALLGSLSDARTSQRHRELATAFRGHYGEDARPELLFVHSAAAGERAVAERYGEQAARKAEQALAFERASSLYLETAELCARAEDRNRLTERAGDALVKGGRTKDAAVIFEGLAREPTVANLVAIRRKAAEAYLVTGHHEEGLRLWREAVLGMGLGFPDSPSAAALAAARALLRARFPGLPSFTRARSRGQAREHAAAALAAAKGLIATNPMHGVCFGAESLVHARRAGDAESLVTSLSFVAAACLAAAGGVWRRWAVALLDEADVHARLHPHAHLPAIVTIMRAQIALFQGRWAEAAALGADGLAVLAATGHARTWEGNMARLARVRSLEELGAFHPLAAEADEWRLVSEESGDAYGLVTAHLTLGIASLATATPEAAERHAAQADRLWRGDGYSVQRFYADRIRVLSALQRGERERASVLLARVSKDVRASMIYRIPTGRVDTLWMESRVALGRLRAVPAAALPVLRRSARALANEDHAPARAHAVFIRAHLATAETKRARAREAFSEAAALYEAAGMTPLAHLAAACVSETAAARAVERLAALGVADPIAWAHGHGIQLPGPRGQSKSEKVSEATR